MISPIYADIENFIVMPNRFCMSSIPMQSFEIITIDSIFDFLSLLTRFSISTGQWGEAKSMSMSNQSLSY